MSASGAHTNNIESQWNAVKKSLPKYGTDKELYNSYLAEYCIRRKFQDNSVDKLLEFFRLISRVYSNESAHAEPASQATPILAVSATPADGLLSQATPPSATSAIVDSIPCRAITLRPDIGEVGTFDLQFDVCSDTEYDSYIMDTSANMFA